MTLAAPGRLIRPNITPEMIGGGATPSGWAWASDTIDALAVLEFHQVADNSTILSTALDRNIANFGDRNGTWAEGDVPTQVGAASTLITGYCGGAFNWDTGQALFRGPGHNQNKDGSIFSVTPAGATANWSLLLAGPRYIYDYDPGATITMSFSNFTATNPATVEVSAANYAFVRDGMQATISGSTDADGTYHVVRAGSNILSLHNVDGDSTAQFTSFDGSSKTTTTGTLALNFQPINPNGVTDDLIRGFINKDGIYMPPCMHTMHEMNWIGGNKYTIGGRGIQNTNGGMSPGCQYFLDLDLVDTYGGISGGYIEPGYYDDRGTGVSDSRLTPYGFSGWASTDVGMSAWDPFNERLVVGDFDSIPVVNVKKTYVWSADFLFKQAVATGSGTDKWQPGRGAVFPHPNDPTKYAVLEIYDATYFTLCTDIYGTASMARYAFSGGLASIGSTNYANFALVYHPYTGKIYYWNGVSAIGEITIPSDMNTANFTAAVVSGTASGDNPTSQVHSQARCEAVPVPDKPALALLHGGNYHLVRVAA